MKAKRLISLIVVLTMLMTLFTGVAGAADGTTIDFGTAENPKTGSIQVHKYVTTSNVDPGNNDPTGTSADGSKVENDYYKPLKDAEFMLFKIADADAVKNYYNGKTETAYDIDKFVFNYSEKTATYDGNSVEAIVVGKDDDEQDVIVLKTDDNGTCKFEKLPLGIYALVESKAPDYIASPYSAPCLVSIPMVNTDTSDNTNNWIYDVNVYPKNYDFATLELTKQDDNGEGLNGVTFALYKKVIDVNGDLADAWSLVTKGASLDATNKDNREVVDLNLETSTIDDNNNNTIDDSGRLVLSGLTSGQYGTQYKLVEVSSVDSYIVNKHPLYFTVNKDNTITYNDTVASVVASDYKEHTVHNDETDTDELVGHDVVVNGKYVNNNHDVTNTPNTDEKSKTYPPTLYIKLKNARPYLEKKVLENKKGVEDADDNWVSSTEYNMGDTIKYQIVTYVPKNIDEIGYTILDTPDYGLTDVITSGHFTITYAELSGSVEDWNDSEISWSTDLVADTDYTLEDVSAVEPTTTTSGNGAGFKLSFKSTKAAGKYVKIVYDAYLNENAVIAGVGNGNKATLTYSKVIGDPNDEDVFVLSDESRVYTYEFEITKRLDNKTTTYTYDQTKGYVKFNLYKNDKSATTPMKLVQVTDKDGNKVDGTYRLPVSDETGDAELIVGENGTLTIQGLENGEYYLEEIDTIKGYNLLSERFEIKIENVATTNWDETKNNYSADGRTLRKYKSTSYTTNQEDNATTVKADIINKKGFVLPQTGSAGFLAFCAVGIVLILGGAMLIFGGRKKKIQ